MRQVCAAWIMEVMRYLRILYKVQCKKKCLDRNCMRRTLNVYSQGMLIQNKVRWVENRKPNEIVYEFIDSNS